MVKDQKKNGRPRAWLFGWFFCLRKFRYRREGNRKTHLIVIACCCWYCWFRLFPARAFDACGLVTMKQIGSISECLIAMQFKVKFCATKQLTLKYNLCFIEMRRKTVPFFCAVYTITRNPFGWKSEDAADSLSLSSSSPPSYHLPQSIPGHTPRRHWSLITKLCIIPGTVYYHYYIINDVSARARPAVCARTNTG